MVILKGSQFVLRPLRKGDEKSLQRNVNDREIARNTASIPYPYTLRHARSWVSRKPSREDFILAITVDDAVVGGIGLHHIERDHKAELGYWLGKDYWGRGIVTEAVQHFTSYGFRHFGLKRIYAYVFPFNTGSIRVLEKVGFHYEGRLVKNALKNGKYLDDLVYAKAK